jgi:hypothetical protein
LKNIKFMALWLVLASSNFVISCSQIPQRIEGATEASGGPRYAVDATWPKPLPNDWILGQVAGIATAKDDTKTSVVRL